MKKLGISIFLLVITFMLFTNLFAQTYDITEYCGQNGLIDRVKGTVTHYKKGDVLNVKQTLYQVNPSTQNYILSDGITINGTDYTFNGCENKNGFIMVSSHGATVESTIKNVTLTNYGNYEDKLIPIIEITTVDDSEHIPTKDSYAKLTLKDVDIIENNYPNHDKGKFNSIIGVGSWDGDINIELNIVSQNKNVNMSSTAVSVLGTLNLKGKNISISEIYTIGKVINDSNLNIGKLLISYDISPAVFGANARPSQEFIGEFINNGTITENDELIVYGKFTNNGIINVSSPVYIQSNNAIFNNKGTMNANNCLIVSSTSIVNNNKNMTVKGYFGVYSTSTFNNNGIITVNPLEEDDDTFGDIFIGGEGDYAIFNNKGIMNANVSLLVFSSNVFNNDGVLISTYTEIAGEFNNKKQWIANGTIGFEGGVLTNNKGTINTNAGFAGDGNIKNFGIINLGGDNSEFCGNLTTENGTVNLLKEASYFGEDTHNFYKNGTLNLANNYIDDSVILNDLEISGTMKLNFDVNLKEEKIDGVQLGNVYTEQQQVQGVAATAEKTNDKISLNKIKILKDSNNKITVFELGNEANLEFIELASSQKKVLGTIFVYKVSYGEQDKRDSDYVNNDNNSNNTGTTGFNGIATNFANNSTGRDSNGNENREQIKTNLLQFERLGNDNITIDSGDKLEGPVNPDLLQSKVSIAGTSISQEEIFDTVFNNAGNYTFFQKQGTNAGDVEDRAAPTLWIKAFGSQEDVDMEDYTKLKTTYYGAVAGLDWDRLYTDNFDATYGIFASYIGGELKDEDYDNKVKQNGGYIGLRGNWYIGKLFVNGIIDYGMISNNADTSSDSNDFNSSVIGLAARVGYNFEVARRSFTIQPSLGLTGKYIITDNFETIVNSNKIKEEIDNITNITIEPGIKLAKNLGKCWILTGEGKYVIENFSGDTRITGDLDGDKLDLILPDMSYKNYANLGLGVEKIWGYTVLHLKGNKTFGGRDGFVVNAGIEFKF